MAAAPGLLAAAAIVSAGTGVASTVLALRSNNPTPPGRSDAEVQEASRRERLRRATAKGRKSTILGGSVGPPGSVAEKTLLGG